MGIMSRKTCDMLIRVSHIYRGSIDAGTSPVDAVASKLGLSYGAAAQRIYRARQAGLLPAIVDRFK